MSVLKEKNRVPNGTNCLILAYKYILDKMGLDWEFLFFAGWKNEFIKNQWNVLIPRNSCNRFVKKNLNWEIEILKGRGKKDRQEVFGKIQHALDRGKHVIVEFNPYYCPWNRAFGRQIFDHYCVVEGIGNCREGLLCRDLYISEQLYRWDGDLFFKSLYEIIMIDQDEKRTEFNEKFVFRYLSDNFPGGLEEIKLTYQYIIDYFRGIQNFKDLFCSSDAELCDSVIAFKQIECNQLGMAMKIEQLNQFNDYGDRGRNIQEAFCETYRVWKKVNSIIYKLFYKNEIKEELLEKLVAQVKVAREIDLNIFQLIGKEANV